MSSNYWDLFLVVLVTSVFMYVADYFTGGVLLGLTWGGW